MSFQDRLALHTWTVDTTALADVLRLARETHWNAVELRRKDFERSFDAGMSNAQVLELIRQSGVRVACIGVETGWIFADGAKRERLFSVLDQTCANAAALHCDLVMSAPGPAVGGSRRVAAASLKAAGDIAQAHGVRFALEFSSGHDVINTLEAAREIIGMAAHPSCGLLLDAYHLERTGAGGRGFAHVPATEIFAFQYSDVPATPAITDGSAPTDRLPPGKGIVKWNEVFGLLREKNYRGFLSYEAPNPLSWARPADIVAREAAEATRALLRCAS